MITEFNSGIYTAVFHSFDWMIKDKNMTIGFIYKDGLSMYFLDNISNHSTEELRAISDLMDSILKQNIELEKSKS